MKKLFSIAKWISIERWVDNIFIIHLCHWNKPVKLEDTRSLDRFLSNETKVDKNIKSTHYDSRTKATTITYHSELIDNKLRDRSIRVETFIEYLAVTEKLDKYSSIHIAAYFNGLSLASIYEDYEISWCYINIKLYRSWYKWAPSNTSEGELVSITEFNNIIYNTEPMKEISNEIKKIADVKFFNEKNLDAIYNVHASLSTLEDSTSAIAAKLWKIYTKISAFKTSLSEAYNNNDSVQVAVLLRDSKPLLKYVNELFKESINSLDETPTVSKLDPKEYFNL